MESTESSSRQFSMESTERESDPADVRYDATRASVTLISSNDEINMG
jgi:hypothetical protein